MSDKRDENFFDSESEARIEEQSKEERLQWLKLLDDMRWVISNAKGRRFIVWLFAVCGVWRLSFSPKDSNQTAFNEGSRDIGLRVLRVLQNADPKAYNRIDDERLADLGKRKKEQTNV